MGGQEDASSKMKLIQEKLKACQANGSTMKLTSILNSNPNDTTNFNIEDVSMNYIEQKRNKQKKFKPHKKKKNSKVVRKLLPLSEKQCKMMKGSYENRYQRTYSTIKYNAMYKTLRK